MIETVGYKIKKMITKVSYGIPSIFEIYSPHKQPLNLAHCLLFLDFNSIQSRRMMLLLVTNLYSNDLFVSTTFINFFSFGPSLSAGY